MSKITDALRRAALERTARAAQAERAASPQSPSQANPPMKEMWEEVRQLEASLSSWDARLPSQPANTPAESSPQQAEETPETAAAELLEETSAEQAEVSETTIAPIAPAEAWNDAIQRCQARLLDCERRAARHSWDQKFLQAQVALQGQMIAEGQKQLDALRQQLSTASQAASTVEAERAAHMRWLSALRECQTLSHSTRMAELELQATGQMVTRITQSQQRLEDERAQYHKRSEELQKSVNTLRFQLGQALARTESANPVASQQALTPPASS